MSIPVSGGALGSSGSPFLPLEGGEILVNEVYESLVLTDSVVKEFTKVHEESIVFAESTLRNANAVFHDLVVYDAFYDQNDFMALRQGSPVGYAELREFHPGDYEYRYGLVGVRVEGSTNTQRAGVTTLVQNVDVKDVLDSGTKTGITAGSGGSTVSYNKTFKVAPYPVAVWIGGGNPAIVEVFNLTTTGFDVRLRDASSPGSYITGDISWSVKGY